MAIPIIGQPKIGQDWFIVIPLECTCGAHMLIAGQVGAVRPCPNHECGLMYRIMKLPEHAGGEINWFIGSARTGRPV